MANTLTIPVTFVDGTDALAADVNSDFNAVATFLNSTKLNDDNIKAGGISSVSLASSAVATANIANQAVTAPCIANNSITQAQLVVRPTKTDGTNPGAGGWVISPSSGLWSTTSGTYTPVTNLSCPLTTTGRPVRLMLVADGNGSSASFVGGSSSTYGQLAFYRGATKLCDLIFSLGTYNLPSGFVFEDLVAAGTYTYTVQALSTGTTTVDYCKLIAYELL